MRRAVAVAAGLVAVVMGCAGAPRIERAELPDAPVLITYLDPEQARQRVELLRDLKQGRARQPGILHLDDLPLFQGGKSARLGRTGAAPGRLALVDPRDGSVTALSAAVPGARPQARSRDGSELLVAAPWRGGSYQLFALRRGSGEVRPLTYGPLAHPMGCFAGEARLAVVQSRLVRGVPNARIAIAERAGTHVRPLTAGPFDLSPACSADGRTLAYVTRRADGGQAIAVIDLARGSEPRIVARGREPVFTPDGRWIVYSAPTSRGPRLWRMRPDGSGKMPLGKGQTEERRPAVSPDARFVAYLAVEDDRLRLRVRRFDGTGDRLLLEQGDVLDVVW